MSAEKLALLMIMKGKLEKTKKTEIPIILLIITALSALFIAIDVKIEQQSRTEYINIVKNNHSK